MNTITNCTFFQKLEEAKQGKPVGQAELTSAFDDFSRQVIAIVDDFAVDLVNSLRSLNYAHMELCSLQRGISVSICEAGEKQNNRKRAF